MSGEEERNKKLLEHLDDMLSGKDVVTDKNLDEDTRTALQTARNMARMQEKSTPEFKAQLKARLIHQLFLQEKEELAHSEDSFIWKLTHRPKWQLTFAALLMVIIFTIIFILYHILK